MITPWFLQVLELYFVVPYPKSFYQNLPSSKSLWEKQFWPYPVDRPSRPTCTAVHVCTSVARPVDRERESCALCFSPVDRTGRPTESFTLWLRPRSTVPVDRLLNCRKSDRWRSTGFSQKVLTDSNSYIFQTSFVLGFSPTTLLTFVSHFSSPINSGRFLQP